MRNRVQYFESNIRHTILNNTIKNIEINQLKGPDKSRDKGFCALTHFFITFVTSYYKYNNEEIGINRERMRNKFQ